MTFFFLLLFFGKIFIVEPDTLKLLCNEELTVEHPDEFGSNMTIHLGAFGVPCHLGGIHYMARKRECACINENQIVDDGTWEVCALHCHRNNTMQIVRFLLDGMTEDFPIFRHKRSIHIARVTTSKVQAPNSVEITDSWENKIEDFLRFAREHWFFIILLGMFDFPEKRPSVWVLQPWQ